MRALGVLVVITTGWTASIAAAQVREEPPATDEAVVDVDVDVVVDVDGDGDGDGRVEEDRRVDAATDEDLIAEDAPLFSARATTPAAPPPSLPASTSDFQLDVGALRAVPRRSAESLLTLAPGLFLVNHSGEYHASTVFVRGFDAGEGQDLEVLVAGVPINEPSNAHGHGYADAHFVIPELVRSIRVAEGPFSPEQSDFAVAGTASYTLGVDARGVRARGELGSFRQRRVLLAWAPADAARGTFVGFDLRESAGFGAQRASTSVALNAGYEHVASRELSLSVLGFGHFAEFASAGVVREDDVLARRLPCAADHDSQFFCSPDPRQGGATARALLAASLVWRRPGTELTQTIWGGFRHLRITENFTGVLLDARGDGLDEQVDTGTAGLRGRYLAEIRAFDDQPQRLELGWVARHDSGTTRALRLRTGTDVPWGVVFDDELHVTHVGAHGAADLRFTEWLALRAGLRADAFAFSTLDRAEPDRDREGERVPLRAADAIGIAISPRGTLRIAPVRGLEWQTSVGLGTRSSDATALSDGEFAPFARAISSESGLALRLDEGAVRLDARASFFHTHVDRDLVFDATRGRNVDAGASSRFGAIAYARLGVERWLDVAASVAWTEAFLLGERTGWDVWTSAERLPFVPRVVARLDAAVEHPISIGAEQIRIGGAIGLGVLGPRPLPLGGEAGSVVLIDAQAHVAWRVLELGVEVQNLLDQRWQSAVFRHASQFDPDVASRAPAIHFAAGAPISAIVSLTVHVDESRPLEGPSVPDPG